LSIIYYQSLPAIEHYFRPKTVEEAISLLTDYGKKSKVLAGGTDLLVLMRGRTLTPKCIIDIRGIANLDYVSQDVDRLKIGALATLRMVELRISKGGEYISLYEAIHQMGSTQIRNMGTVVGNICRASPSSDTAPPLLTFGASAEIVGPNGARSISLDDFFIGPGETVVKHDEIVKEIQVPRLPTGSGKAFLRVTRVAADLAKVNAAALIVVRGKDGICQDAKIALGGVAPTPMRTRRAELLLIGSKLNRELINNAALTAADEAKPITDIRSTQEYRKALSEVLVRRTIDISWERAKRNLGV
jgi:carbon-monoxide dehydrogenase medium subunit